MQYRKQSLPGPLKDQEGARHPRDNPIPKDNSVILALEALEQELPKAEVRETVQNLDLRSDSWGKNSRRKVVI